METQDLRNPDKRPGKYKLLNRPFAPSSAENGYEPAAGELAYYSDVLDAHLVLGKSEVGRYEDAPIFDEFSITRRDQNTLQVIQPGDLLIRINPRAVTPVREQNLLTIWGLNNLDATFSLLHEYSHDPGRDVTIARYIFNAINNIISGQYDWLIHPDPQQTAAILQVDLDTYYQQFNNEHAEQILTTETLTNSLAANYFSQILTFCNAPQDVVETAFTDLKILQKLQLTDYQQALTKVMGLSIDDAVEQRKPNMQLGMVQTLFYAAAQLMLKLKQKFSPDN